MLIRIIGKLFLTTFLIIIYGLVFSQNANEKFGRNRLQTKQFDWKYLSSTNYDVHYYEANKKMAVEINEFLEEQFDRITDLIGFPPYTKTKIFIYNSVADLQQSNVGIGEGTYGLEGETQFVKSYVEVAHPGTISGLKKELLDKISELLVNQMMYGGNFGEMFKNSVLLNLPEWFVLGVGKYVALGWSMQMDDFIRNFIDKKSIKKLRRLKGKEAALAGQSVWNYIAYRYGNSSISNILNYTRVIRNEKRSIEVTLGISFGTLMNDWRDFYMNEKRNVHENYTSIENKNSVIKLSNSKKQYNYTVKINPDASKIAYTENNNGRYSVVVYDVETKAKTIILRGGYSVIGQQIAYDYPILDWMDKSTLGIIHSQFGQVKFVLYDLNTNSKIQRIIKRLSQVKSMEFSSNGRLLIMSAVANGRNDLYLMSTRKNRIKRLTNDIFDDVDPSFIPNTNAIVFSSNRLVDTLNTENKNIQSIGENYNLFIYDLDTTKLILKRLTNTISQDVKPYAINANKIFYISDQRGINNLFSYTIDNKLYQQVSNFQQSINHFDVNFETSSLAFISSNKKGNSVIFDKNFQFNAKIFTPSTLMYQLKLAKQVVVNNKLKEKQTNTIEEMVNQRQRILQKKIEKENDEIKINELLSDSVYVSDQELFIDTDNYTFDIFLSEKSDTTNQVGAMPNTIINTEDYVFEGQSKEESNQLKFLSQYRKKSFEDRIKGPFPHEVLFSADYFLGSYVIDPLRGFGVLTQLEFNDMLENYKFTGGANIINDLRSGDFFADFKYLKLFFDFNIRLERNVYLFEGDYNLNNLNKNSLEVGVSLPFSTKARLSLKPFYTFINDKNLLTVGGVSAIPPVYEGIKTHHYIGTTLEAVYDNSIITEKNAIRGTRAKMTFKNFEALSNISSSFANFHLDIRHYQNIHRGIIFAMKGVYGSFFGKKPQKYMVGGVDNWLGNAFNTQGTNNPLRETENTDFVTWIFSRFETSVRGFDYAERYGNNALLFNAELRIPLIRYFSSGPINSSFFKNLQFTGFFDVGTAWTGASLFGNLRRNIEVPPSNGAFTIFLKNYQNPWIYSYGFGFRTMLLGYYVKLDLAYPIDDFIELRSRFVLSLGYDF